MHPELQQDVVGFKRGVGRQQRTPVTVRILEREEMFGRQLKLLLRGGDERVS
jgi:hypothetical protein